MDLRTRWRRLEAEQLVYLWGVLVTALLVPWALWVAVSGIGAGVPAAGLLSGGVVALAGWLTSAWDRERPWAWYVWTIGTGGLFAAGLGAAAELRPLAVPLLLVSGVLLLLLCHPDSRARVEPAPHPS